MSTNLARWFATAQAAIEAIQPRSLPQIRFVRADGLLVPEEESQYRERMFAFLPASDTVDQYIGTSDVVLITEVDLVVKYDARANRVALVQRVEEDSHDIRWALMAPSVRGSTEIMLVEYRGRQVGQQVGHELTVIFTFGIKHREPTVRP